MATSWKSQQGDGTYRLQFETDDVEKYKLVEKASQMAVDGKTTTDVVEVVRCKKCLHKINYKGRPMCILYAENIFGDWHGLIATRDEHFCSYGERRDT